MSELKDVLRIYLNEFHSAIRWKVEGLSEADLRRPMTPTGSNLIGIVKHVASIELGYLTDCVGRPNPAQLPWISEDSPLNSDMYLTADESSSDIIELLDLAEREALATLEALPLDAPAHVPWWGAGDDGKIVTLGRLIVHVINDAVRHVGHMDILREMIDGDIGLHKGNDNIPEQPERAWADYVAELQAISDRFKTV